MSDGLKLKYQITKADGRPASGRYFVLKVDSKDTAHAEACKKALEAYAESIIEHGHGSEHLLQLADDILMALIDHSAAADGWATWDRLIGGER